jgi:hypothetical protein
MTENPKLFISYSWTTPAHEKWVVTLAEELVSQGIDVVIDKWNLRPGHDANAFMEGMVTDESVTKVLLVCDAKYAEKSDARAGGAGTEAQIITPQLYAKRAQDKFVAVVRENNVDGTPCLPTYYRGRIYFDLSDDGKYAQEFEGLVRWAWDKPAYVKSNLGKKPSFLSDDTPSIKLPTSAAFRRAQEAIRSGREQSGAYISEYFGIIASELEQFRITVDSNGDGQTPYDEKIVANIQEFVPYRNEIVELFIAIAMFRATNESMTAIHRFFEQLEPYLRRPEQVNSYREEDYDNFRFIVHELFLYASAVFIKYERFAIVTYLLDTEYYTGEQRNSPMRPYTIFREYLRSFESRGRRLSRLSARADLLKERSQAVGVEFRYLMAADFVLYLRACDGGRGSGWWPETLLYASRYSTTIEIFARAKSKSYFDKIAPMLGVSSRDELAERIASLDQRRIPKWEFDGIDPSAMSRLDELASTP